MKNIVFALILFFSFTSISSASAGSFKRREVVQKKGTAESRATDEKYRKMFAQNSVMNDAWDFQRRLELSKAIETAKQAQGADYITDEEDRSGPLFFELITAVYKGDYELALKAANELHRIAIIAVPHADGWLEQKKKIEALLEFQKTGNKQLIYDWIASQKKKYAHWLPPTNPKKTVWDSFLMVEFVALYDLLGDYDLALAEIAPFLKLYREVGSGETGALENLIKALQESKSGMPKICIEDGKVCLGRATAYIIKSKSF